MQTPAWYLRSSMFLSSPCYNKVKLFKRLFLKHLTSCPTVTWWRGELLTESTKHRGVLAPSTGENSNLKQDKLKMCSENLSAQSLVLGLLFWQICQHLFLVQLMHKFLWTCSCLHKKQRELKQSLKKKHTAIKKTDATICNLGDHLVIEQVFSWTNSQKFLLSVYAWDALESLNCTFVEWKGKKFD